jgi:hypothetical protein
VLFGDHSAQQSQVPDLNDEYIEDVNVYEIPLSQKDDM